MSCCVDDFFWLILVVQDASIDWTGLERRTKLSSKGSQPSSAPAVSFEIQKAMQTFPAVLTSDPTNGLISDKILCRTYSVRLLYREVSRHDSCFVSDSQRSRLKTAQLYVRLHLVVKSGNTYKPTYKG